MVRTGSDVTGNDTSGNDATESEETDITQEWTAQNSFFFLKPLITLNGTLASSKWSAPLVVISYKNSARVR